MEVMIAVQSGTLLRALRVQLKRRVPARTGGDCKKFPQAIQTNRCPTPSNFATPFACKLLSEQGRVFASHFPSDEVQDEAEVRGSTPVSANDWGKNMAAVAVLINFALYWPSMISMRAMQLEVELLSAIVVLIVDCFLPFLQSAPRNSRDVVVV